MKKILFWSVLAMMAAVSCNKELENNTPEAPETEPVTFIATVDGAETKTILGTDRTPMWAGEESITIHNGTNGYLFTATADAAGEATATFSYTGDDFTGDKFLAVYPAGTYTADVTAKTVSGINIPKDQFLVSGTYPSDAAVAVAYSEDNTLQFRNAVTILAFQVKNEGVTYGSFYSVDQSVDISGSFDVTLGENNVPSLSSKDQNHWVDFKIDNNGTELKPNTTYYIAIAPSEFPADGFVISLNGMIVKEYKKAFTFERNTIYNFGTLELPLPETWNICGSINKWGDTAMTLEGDWFVAKDLTITKDDEFKFRSPKDNDPWGYNRGGSSDAMVADTEYSVWNNGENMKVSESAIYDVYLHKNAHKMKIVKVGEASLDDVVWYVAGSFNKWNTSDADYKMTVEGNFNVLKNVELSATDEFKFTNGGIYLAIESDFSANSALFIGGGNNMKVAAGTYDIYLSKDNQVVYFMTGGNTPSSVIISDPASVGLSGDFSDASWVAPSGKYSAEFKGSENLLYTYNMSEIDLSSSTPFKVRIAEGWYGNGQVTLEGLTYTDNGGNLKPSESGKYNIEISFLWNGSYPKNIKAVFTKVE